jgi:predicted component of type VI protein secretion system
LDAESTVIGRSVECDIRLNDTGVSRRHGEVRRMPDGQFLYIDAGSTNGSIVNGRAATQVKLVNGDQIELGSTIITFRRGDGRGREAARPGDRVSTPPPADGYGRRDPGAGAGPDPYRGARPADPYGEDPYAGRTRRPTGPPDGDFRDPYRGYREDPYRDVTGPRGDPGPRAEYGPGGRAEAPPRRGYPAGEPRGGDQGGSDPRGGGPRAARESGSQRGHPARQRPADPRSADRLPHDYPGEAGRTDDRFDDVYEADTYLPGRMPPPDRPRDEDDRRRRPGHPAPPTDRSEW